MSADPKAPAISTDDSPAQLPSEPPTPVAASTSAAQEAKSPTAAEAASSAASQAAGAAAAAGAAVQNAANTARARAQQHGFYQGNIEEELGQVVKSLGSFWGGFKARSASTFTTLKADAGKGLAQVQNDLKQLQDVKVEVGVKEKEDWEREQEEERKKKEEHEAKEAEEREREAALKDKGKGRALPEDEAGPDGLTSPTSAFFSRLTNSTSSLQATLQGTLNSTLAAAKANPALSNPTQLRDQLAENLRLSSARENLTLSLRQAEALAEDYLKKGSEWARNAEQAAEKWVEENVKVVPPEGIGATLAMASWDTGELYSFSTMVPEKQEVPTGEGGRTPRASLSSAAVAGSRKEALLRRLREDMELLLLDPGAKAETQQRRDEFAAWVRDTWPTAQTTGREAEVGNVGGIRMALVPEHLTDEQFWQRYLFHKDMIEAADKKRKALLEASTADDGTDDFNWDDDEEEHAGPSAKDDKPVSPAPSGPSVPSSAATPKPPAVAKITPATSPRDSEESYDVVRTSTAAPTEDSDSDWE
ncbi:hypothetical protein CcaverHIS002_0304570 [Cutaneotrichosporon cavernicola]|uniref:BSD domain-containing protein n=1 Tax=Cutaneotrichosporon cavernicola TaxID=279322 RepID=A0AA48L2S9_9TREE|nr:uncharacterized protein CcaverHIS019_0304530 [Cutaneotrichosporon cavernicola]BEI82589.1 hypothetical protein CcaverHIS002_0304570 [Cutaneotrichosporon cavernicola]BEI90383.1 hypothetical protein CcaverHIS019_0304530 [Cutaneotrichosporon cavernicola]BEI98159.1 hypothetical protein CcaverHIS631_0304580 [Cutaneotrichosporon cavernicola]BEJ05936.1 hypothetical protein CcaverHIS641_0304580 [Cutaneotrichosporon cavernicola]